MKSAQLSSFFCSTLWPTGGRVDHFARHPVFERGSQFVTQVEFLALDRAADLNGHIGCQHAALHHLAAFIKCGSVPQSLLRGGIGLVFGHIGELEQFVGGRDDIFDLGTGARLEEWQGIHENCGIRDQLSGLLELGHGDTALSV